MFFIAGVMLLCKVWTKFLLVYSPWLTDCLLYCCASQNPYVPRGFLQQHVSSKNPSALSGTGIFWPFKWECWKKSADFAAHLKVNHSLYRFDFLQDLIPHRQPGTENICLWLTGLMLRFVSAASSCLRGAGRRWHCCSGCLCPGPDAFLPKF